MLFRFCKQVHTAHCMYTYKQIPPLSNCVQQIILKEIRCYASVTAELYISIRILYV